MRVGFLITANSLKKKMVILYFGKSTNYTNKESFVVYVEFVPKLIASFSAALKDIQIQSQRNDERYRGESHVDRQDHRSPL